MTEVTLSDYRSLQVVDEMPFCQRCRRTLPRSTSDPCQEPDCQLANLSLIALWQIIDERKKSSTPDSEA